MFAREKNTLRKKASVIKENKLDTITTNSTKGSECTNNLPNLNTTIKMADGITMTTKLVRNHAVQDTEFVNPITYKLNE